jgi:MbtH protein
VTNPFEDDNAEYLILVNEEGQYSLWPRDIDVPAGWAATGPSGARQDCLRWIDANWIDMRPKSLVKQMDDAARARAQA